MYSKEEIRRSERDFGIEAPHRSFVFNKLCESGMRQPLAEDIAAAMDELREFVTKGDVLDWLSGLYDGGAGGVKIYGKSFGCAPCEETYDCSVTDCRIDRCGRRYFAACGVLIMHAHHCVVEHCEIGNEREDLLLFCVAVSLDGEDSACEEEHCADDYEC